MTHFYSLKPSPVPKKAGARPGKYWDECYAAVDDFCKTEYTSVQLQFDGELTEREINTYVITLRQVVKKREDTLPYTIIVCRRRTEIYLACQDRAEEV